MTGKPISLAISTASSAVLITPTWPGTTFTLAFWARSLDSILSPIASMALALGPIKATPSFSSRLAKPAFSDRKP